MTRPIEPGKPEKDPPTDEPGERAVARLRRAQRAADKVMKRGEAYPVKTRQGGTVHFGKVTFTEDGDHSRVDVRVDGSTDSGEAHFIIVNPPTLARDPNGDVEINGTRYREDPLGALADVIADLGGARKERGRRGRKR